MDRRTKSGTAWVLAAGLLFASAAAAQSTDPERQPGLAGAFLQGEVRFNFRYRFEYVDADAFADPVRASTLRSRLTWRSAAWRQWSALIEIDDVRSIGNELYDSTRNAGTDRPIVTDPVGTEINQAALQYLATSHSLVLGRQRLNLDDQRFVGTSSWRQNEQTFDALTARARLPRTDIAYSHVVNVNRPVGPDDGSPPADLRGRLHLLNAGQDARALGSVTAYAYLLDFDDAATLSSRTFGMRWTGNYPIAGGWRALQTMAYARQVDGGDNPSDYTAGYWQIEAGLKRNAWSLSIGRETLEGDPTAPGRSFQTPLATLHAFQGWADVFSTTPDAGIEDTYVALAGSAGDLEVRLVWHDFAAKAVDRDYGREWDVSVSYEFVDRYTLLLKAADYAADGFSTDTTKLWLQFAASF